jgi:hypothetical protein
MSVSGNRSTAKPIGGERRQQPTIPAARIECLCLLHKNIIHRCLGIPFSSISLFSFPELHLKHA